MSKAPVILKADERTVVGRKVKRLRLTGIIPANVFGKKIKSEALQVDLKEFKTVYSEVGETGLVDLKIGTEKAKHVLVHDVQQNPVTDVINHVNFMEVDLKQKINAQVPVKLIGESPAEKQSLGTVVLLLNEVEVEALPTDFPEHFEVNIDNLAEVDQAIYVKDLVYDKAKVTILEDVESLVAKVEPPQKEEMVEVVAEVPVEGEVAVAPATEGATPEQSSGQAS